MDARGDAREGSPTRGVNPDEAVAHGAAVQGGILGGDDETTNPQLWFSKSSERTDRQIRSCAWRPTVRWFDPGLRGYGR